MRSRVRLILRQTIQPSELQTVIGITPGFGTAYSWLTVSLPNEFIMNKKEWIDFGGGLGRMRDPALARSPEVLKQNAEEMGKLLSELMGRISNHTHPIEAYWYTLGTIQKYLDEAKKDLESDLFHLGVLVPEKFDWKFMKKSTKKTNSKRKKR